jgi:pimeloyl-ACP methyl ester carboxylesterase
MTLARRSLLLAAVASAVLLAGCARPPKTASLPPVVFVHGNGDNAGLWTTTVWRFESNGWPRERLFTVDVPYPLSRDDDAKPQDGRTSAAENMQAVAAEVDRALKATGAKQVVLVGNSRGGNAIRSYVESAAGANKVSQAILGGTPSHGVYADPKSRLGNEFNGAGPFLMGLNAPKGRNGDEVSPQVEWLTVRSDKNDKFAQPEGTWIGAKGVPTNVTYEGPALKGAWNVELPGIDHRETSYSPQAFEQAYRFITGKKPARTTILPEATVVLDGKVSGLGLNNQQGGFPTNLPLAGATVEVHLTNPATGERLGPPVHTKTVGADGLWGPFKANPAATYEFEVSAPGYATTHIYRQPFPRSSKLVTLLAQRLAPADKDALSVVTLTRPRGYFGLPRDTIVLDGRNPAPGIPVGVAGVATSKLKVTDGANRPVVGEFNGERIAGWAWPAADNHVVFLELH